MALRARPEAAAARVEGPLQVEGAPPLAPAPTGKVGRDDPTPRARGAGRPGRLARRTTTRTRRASGSSSRRRGRRADRQLRARRSTWRSASAGSTGRVAARRDVLPAALHPADDARASGRRSTASTSRGSARRSGCGRPGWPRSRPRRRTAAGTPPTTRRRTATVPDDLQAELDAQPEGGGVLRHALERQPLRDPVPDPGREAARDEGAGGSPNTSACSSEARPCTNGCALKYTCAV